MNQYLANHGFIVLSVNIAAGHWLWYAVSRGLELCATGASEFQDVLGAGLYMRGRST